MGEEIIKKKIDEATERPVTAENLNYIGDLYLKIENKHKAISCFYGAISKMHSGQKEKKIAIYKKIIRLSSTDIRAYEGIINVYSEIGLAVEEIEYLMILANLYQNEGNYHKVNSALKRVKTLNPDFIIPDNFLNEWEELSEREYARRVDILEIEDRLELDKSDYDTDDLLTESTFKIEIEPVEVFDEEGDYDKKEISDEEYKEDKDYKEYEEEKEYKEDREDEKDGKEKNVEEVEIVAKVVDSVEAGISPAAPEESVDVKEKKPFYVHDVIETEETNKRLFLYAGAALLFLIVTISAFLVLKDKTGNDFVEVGEIGKSKIEKIWDGKAELNTDRYKISVSGLSREMVETVGIPGLINNEDIKNKQFYTVSIKAKKGCLPDNFIRSPILMISMINKGLFEKINEIKELNSLNKVFYKVGSCSREEGAVFMKVLVYHNRDFYCTGLAINGLEKDYPLIIKWQ